MECTINKAPASCYTESKQQHGMSSEDQHSMLNESAQAAQHDEREPTKCMILSAVDQKNVMEARENQKMSMRMDLGLEFL